MTPIEKALKTWHPLHHPLHNDPLHPAIGLAGEAGELLNLYKKERFKDGVSWWDCVHCNESEDWHSRNNSRCSGMGITAYTPKILDELGDLWYYLRIIIYQNGLPIAIPILESLEPDTIVILSKLNKQSAKLLEYYTVYLGYKRFVIETLNNVNYLFFMLLRDIDCTLDELTELNWNKLKDGNHNGWKEAKENYIVDIQ